MICEHGKPMHICSDCMRRVSNDGANASVAASAVAAGTSGAVGDSVKHRGPEGRCDGCHEYWEGVIGIVRHDGPPRICVECLRREGLLLEELGMPRGIGFTVIDSPLGAPPTVDRDFGSGIPGMIAQECYALRDLLLQKNAAYGNAALDPIRCFSKADPMEQIKVRLDDKLSRLARGTLSGEDVELDLSGYLILLRVARRLAWTGVEFGSMRFALAELCGIDPTQTEDEAWDSAHAWLYHEDEKTRNLRRRQMVVTLGMRFAEYESDREAFYAAWNAPAEKTK